MILIGSRAARYWFPDFREPHDFDVVATAAEVAKFEKNNPVVGKRSRKYYEFLTLANGEEWQFEIPGKGNESALLIKGEKELKIRGMSIWVASPSTLLAIKKSHLVKALRLETWKKHIEDYHFLKERTSISQEDKSLVTMRRFEVEYDSKIQKPNLDMDNDEFFAQSQYFIKRVYVHDDLHEAVKFGKRPLYMELKDDQSRASCSRALFNKLSHQDQINTVREESFVIALERKVIPKGWLAKQAFEWALYRICTTLTSGWFRNFALENYFEILDTDYDFVEKFNKAKPFLRRYSEHP